MYNISMREMKEKYKDYLAWQSTPSHSSNVTVRPFSTFALATVLSSLPIRKISPHNNASTSRGCIGGTINPEMRITRARARPDSDLMLRISGAHTVV